MCAVADEGGGDRTGPVLRRAAFGVPAGLDCSTLASLLNIRTC